MDKTVIFAVAGSGKTTHIVESLSYTKRSLIVTYTEGNYINLFQKISRKFDNKWPENITLMTYFQFLFRFCYKPFLADIVKAKGIIFKANPSMRIPQSKRQYYINSEGYLYSNRIALLLEKQNVVCDIKERMIKYFDEFIIDEIQDIAGRDFLFLEQLMDTNINMFFVGDFYQHTFDTSRDGNVNKNLFQDRLMYEKRYKDKGFNIDRTTLQKSWRCSESICNYIRQNLGIEIYSNRTDNSIIKYVSDISDIAKILKNEQIVKLHYQNGAKFGIAHKNWGETKGEDKYQDVCVILNKTTASKRKAGRLLELAPSTKNKLYVAITRAKRNVYFIDEQKLK